MAMEQSRLDLKNMPRSRYKPLIYSIILPKHGHVTPEGEVVINGLVSYFWSERFPWCPEFMGVLVEVGELYEPVTLFLQLLSPDLELVGQTHTELSPKGFSHSHNWTAAFKKPVLNTPGNYCISVLYLDRDGKMDLIDFRPFFVYARPSPGVFLAQIKPDDYGDEDVSG